MWSENHKSYAYSLVSFDKYMNPHTHTPMKTLYIQTLKNVSLWDFSFNDIPILWRSQDIALCMFFFFHWEREMKVIQAMEVSGSVLLMMSIITLYKSNTVWFTIVSCAGFGYNEQNFHKHSCVYKPFVDRCFPQRWINKLGAEFLGSRVNAFLTL